MEFKFEAVTHARPNRWQRARTRFNGVTGCAASRCRKDRGSGGAAEDGHKQLVDLLLKRGAKVNAQDSIGTVPGHSQYIPSPRRRTRLIRAIY